jgi:gliding motility-associated-like protein
MRQKYTSVAPRIVLFFLTCFFSLHSYSQNDPTFTSSPVTSVNENDLYNYSITTNDIDGDYLTVTATTKPSWLSLSFTPSSVVSTFAGSTFGFADGIGTAARFNTPIGVTLDATGNMYVTDNTNHRIRKITPTGTVSTLAGSFQGFADGTGISAQFFNPVGVVADATGNIYVADSNNARIRKITPTGTVSTFAGTTEGFGDGTGTAAQFDTPYEITIDASGNIYVADFSNHKIRKITPAGEVTTLAGSTQGFTDGTGTAAQFNNPSGVAVDTDGNVYVADFNNRRIRKVTPAGVVTTIPDAGVLNPSGVAVDILGNIYVTSFGENKISKITPADVVSTIVEGPDINGPEGVVIDPSGNIYIASYSDSKIQKIASEITLTGTPTHADIGIHDVVLEVSDGKGGVTLQTFQITVLDTTPPSLTTASPLDEDTNVATSTNLTITFSEDVQKGTTGDILIKKTIGDDIIATLAITSSEITIVGNIVTINPSIDLPSYTEIYIQIPSTVFKDLSNNSYAGFTNTTTWNFTTGGTAPTFTSTPVLSVEENNLYNYLVKVEDIDGDDVTVTATTKPSWLTFSSNRVSSVLAGAAKGFANGTGTAAQFDNLDGIAMDATGNIYVADISNHKIRKITPAGVVTTFAGSTQGFADGTGTAAQFNTPIGIAIDATGNLYVTDNTNYKIRKITPAGVVSTLAGSTQGYADGTGVAAQFNSTFGITVDATGNLYVADMLNHKIRKITSTGVVSTLAGSINSPIQDHVDGPGTSAKFNHPRVITIDATGNLYVLGANNKTRKITPVGYVTTILGSLEFPYARGIAIDIKGNFYISENENYRVRKVTPAGVATTFAESPDIDGPRGIIVDDTTETIYISSTDPFNPSKDHKIQKISIERILTGTPTHADIGVHDVVLEVSDDKGGVTLQTFQITVLDVTDPTLTTLSPLDDSTVAITTNLVMTFSENIQIGTGDIFIKNTIGDAVIASLDVATSSEISILNNLVTINPSANLPSETEMYVQIPATAFKDAAGNFYAGITDTTTWSFTTEDTTNPILATPFLDPADNDTDVAITTNLVMTFSENIQIGTGNIFIKNTIGDAVIASLDVATSSEITILNNVVTINPSANLPSQTGIYVEIPNTVFTDLSGNAYVGFTDKNTWNFTTADITAPTLTLVSPADNSTNVAIATDLVMTFSENIQIGTGNILIKNTSNDNTIATLDVATSSEITILNNLVTINPSANLPSQTEMYVQIPATAFKDAAGNFYAGISDKTIWNFTTENSIISDITAPTLITLSPADNSVDVDPASDLTIAFSENIQIGTGNILIKNTSDDTTIATIDVATSEVTILNSLVAINPLADLPSETDIYIEIPNGAFTDMSGNSFSGFTDKTIWNFTTKDAIVSDITAPTLTTVLPINNSIEIPTTTNLVMTFSEDMSTGTGNIILRKTSDDSVIAILDATSSEVTIVDNIVTINPSTDLPSETEIYIQIPTTAFKDTSNNAYAGFTNTTTWNFTTKDIQDYCGTDETFNEADCQPVIAIKDKYGFSPNGDGNNDTWTLEDIDLFPNNIVHIYNRSGKLVYEMNGYNNSFGGISNKANSSEKLPVGPYYFTVELNIPEVVPAKGWLYINY